MPDVVATEFTDPACPWAYSAEPFRLRMRWLYGEQLEWRTRMVVLREQSGGDLPAGYTPERLAGALAWIAREHGMPIDAAPRPRIAATAPACRAVVAARLHAPESEWPLLRALYLGNFAGGLLDDPDTIGRAAVAAGLDPAQLAAWAEEPEVEAALREDMRLARDPLPAARVLDERLRGPASERRYSCPSFDFARQADGVVIAVPGFNLMGSYEVVLANLLPHVAQRPRPASANEILEWAGEPLATREVAVLRGVAHEQALEELRGVAEPRAVGDDWLWTMPGATAARDLRAA